MERHIILLAGSAVADFSAHPPIACSDIHVVLHHSTAECTLATTRQLLQLQRTYQCPVELVTTAASTTDSLYLASLLGRYSARYADASITLAGYTPCAEALAELGLESGQILYFHDATNDITESAKPAEPTLSAPVISEIAEPEPAIAAEAPHTERSVAVNAEIPVEATAPEVETATVADTTAAPMADVHSFEAPKPEEKTTEIGNMIKQKEERKKKNEQIINALMRKVTEFPYKIMESKPVSGVMNEQEVETPAQEVPVNKAI